MPAAAEGDLSKLRSRVVSRALLGRRAEEMGIGPLMLLGRGERQTGGARRRSVLGSALEALIGAIHLRLGPAASDRFARQCVIAPILEKIQGDEAPGDSKSALQEWSQRVHGCVPEYRRISDSGPDHAKAFAVEVSVAGRTLARGEGPRIKSAENQAARRALEAIEKDGLQITKGG
jgi:ribonuclease-3